MDFNSLRRTTRTTPDVLRFGVDIASKHAGEWYLNEEHVFIKDLDEAIETLREKASITESKRLSLIEETYSYDQAVAIIKKYNNKVTQGILESCVDIASSKSLTNRKEVLELRKSGLTVSDKYVFVLESGEVVALGESDLSLLEKFDDELLEYANASSDNLKRILKETY